MKKSLRFEDVYQFTRAQIMIAAEVGIDTSDYTEAQMQSADDQLWFAAEVDKRLELDDDDPRSMCLGQWWDVAMVLHQVINRLIDGATPESITDAVLINIATNA